MPLHDTSVVYGVSEQCKYNCHEECRVPRCGCTCHQPKLPEVTAQGMPAEPFSLPKACPICGVKRPAHEVYCRLDGSKLTSLLCPMCGSTHEQGDQFCWACGVDFTKKSKTTEVPKQVKTEALEETEQAILRALQRELGEANDSTFQLHIQDAVGKLKLTSKPNPGQPGATHGSEAISKPSSVGARTKIKLPFKPS